MQHADSATPVIISKLKDNSTSCLHRQRQRLLWADVGFFRHAVGFFRRRPLQTGTASSKSLRDVGDDLMNAHVQGYTPLQQQVVLHSHFDLYAIKTTESRHRHVESGIGQFKRKISKNSAIRLPRVNFSGYVGHATIFNWMLTTVSK